MIYDKSFYENNEKFFHKKRSIIDQLLDKLLDKLWWS